MKIVVTTLLVIFSVSMFFAPTVVLAQGNVGGGGSTANSIDGGGTAGATKLANPLGSDNNDPRKIVGNIIQAILGLAGSLALLVFILGGLNWVTSAGSEEKVKKGKEMIIWATLGLIVIFASYTLVGFILDALVGTGTGAG